MELFSSSHFAGCPLLVSVFLPFFPLGFLLVELVIRYRLPHRGFFKIKGSDTKAFIARGKTCDYVTSEAVFQQNLSKIFASIKDFHGFANGFFLRRSGHLSWKAAKYKLCLHGPCGRDVERGLDGVFYPRNKVGMLQASTKTFEFEGGPQRMLMHGIGVFGVTLKNGDGEVRESLMQFLDGCIVFKDGDPLKIN